MAYMTVLMLMSFRRKCPNCQTEFLAWVWGADELVLLSSNVPRDDLSFCRWDKVGTYLVMRSSVRLELLVLLSFSIFGNLLRWPGFLQ